MSDLTPAQRKVLEFVCRHIDRVQRPPTRAEIAMHCGYKSANAAEEHLVRLHRKGFIELSRDTARGIKVMVAP